MFSDLFMDMGNKWRNPVSVNFSKSKFNVTNWYRWEGRKKPKGRESGADGDSNTVTFGGDFLSVCNYSLSLPSHHAQY